MTPTTPPTLLVIDTASDRCRLALSHAGHPLQFEGDAGSSHLEPTMAAIERLLRERGLEARQCDAFVFAQGPGAFTGLRVACTLTQGLAMATGRPAICVGHLDALAAGLTAAPALPPSSQPTRILCALDARLEQAYYGAYESIGGTWQACAAPSVGGSHDLCAAARRWQAIAVAGDVGWLSGYLGSETMPCWPATVSLEAILDLAYSAYAAGRFLKPEDVQPLYVRDRVAQTVAERRAARAGLAPTPA